MKTFSIRVLAIMGFCWLLAASAGSLSTIRADDDGQPTTVQACPVPNADQIGLYTDGGYEGTCALTGVGDYAAIDSLGIPNDSLSSVRVGSNVTATLCYDYIYGGTCEAVTSDVDFLLGHPVGNDTVSSLRVQARTGSVTLQGLATLGSDYAPKSLFQPGEEIIFRHALMNTGGVTGTTRVSWRTTFPWSGEVAALSGITYWDAIPGYVGYMNPSTVPVTASVGTYTLVATALYVTQTTRTITFTIPGQPDAYEPDNSCGNARWISLGAAAETHNFHLPGDEDWIKFNAVPGSVYYVETLNLPQHSDTYLHLYASDCATQLAFDDDSGPGLGSLVVWPATSTGTLYAKIRPFHSSASTTGGNSYDLRVTAVVSFRSYLPLASRSGPGVTALEPSK